MLGPGHTKDFFGVLAKKREIFLGFHDIRGRRQISAPRFHPASEWIISAAEECPLRFMACDVIFENFDFEGVKTFVSVKVFFSAKVNPPNGGLYFGVIVCRVFASLTQDSRVEIARPFFGVTRPLQKTAHGKEKMNSNMRVMNVRKAIRSGTNRTNWFQRSGMFHDCTRFVQLDSVECDHLVNIQTFTKVSETINYSRTEA